jgi:hypothetical protein
MSKGRSLATIATAVVMAGCGTSGAQHHTTVLPGNGIGAMRSFYVVHRDGDGRNIERDIAQQLIELGFRASSGPIEPENAVEFDAIVTYIDRTMWDMTPYCLQLTLYLRDTRTGFIVATGSSWRPSLVRKTPAGHAKLLLTELLGGSRE